MNDKNGSHTVGIATASAGTGKTFKIRYTVSHMEIPQCAQTVPLHPRI
ncbi:MAG: hypothetical protein ACR650_04050 [Methylocystis sp.]